MKARPTQSRKGVKGQLPLAGSRDSVPCGVWGNAPTVPRATSMPNALNKGAGSEASLPVTLRVRRRASKLLFPTSVLCRAKWARPCSWSYNQSCSFAQAGVSRLRARPKGFPIALWKPSVCAPSELTFSARIDPLVVLDRRVSSLHCLLTPYCLLTPRRFSAFAYTARW